MRHRKRTDKMGRSPSHRVATLRALVCGLIIEKRITTTLKKARVARRMAEKMVTIARVGTLSSRRLALSRLVRTKPVKILFEDITPKLEGRNGGYTRIVKLGRRSSDSSEMAILEWVGMEIPDKRKKKKDAVTSAEVAE